MLADSPQRALSRVVAQDGRRTSLSGQPGRLRPGLRADPAL